MTIIKGIAWTVFTLFAVLDLYHDGLDNGLVDTVFTLSSMLFIYWTFYRINKHIEDSFFLSILSEIALAAILAAMFELDIEGIPQAIGIFLGTAVTLTFYANVHPAVHK